MGRNYEILDVIPAYVEDPLGAYIQGCIDRGGGQSDAWRTMSEWELDEYCRALSGRSMSRGLKTYHQQLLMEETD